MVEQELEKEMSLRTGHINQFVSLDLDTLDKYFCPSLVLLSGRLFGCRSRRLVSLACVVQFIHLATLVHNQAGKKPAFPVLVGDYLYSKFFHYLSRHDSLAMLAPLSKVICDIHEAGITRYQLEKTGQVDMRAYIPVVQREWGRLAEQACSIGGKVAGAGEEEEARLRELGFNLGVAWGIQRLGLEEKLVTKHLSRAKEVLFLLPDRKEREYFLELINLLQVKPEEIHKILAV
ncbi:geranylgeranyl pyrophosphate synthase [Calderihabitans maritimus]|uniref:Geranylgeranyl pyrophosphate synthase n=2 Tax=Calderihabitans maritimus TaxID=1246530 RepID=A0A1Z5HR32_9FIRM|nr:geranylgeranyl pyrophosphate synthase [Calderihabitans maritimus]